MSTTNKGKAKAAPFPVPSASTSSSPLLEFDEIAAKAFEALSNPTGIEGAMSAREDNPSCAALEWLLSLLKVDVMKETGICPWCHEDEALTKQQRNKNWGRHLSQHIWSCARKHRCDEVLCPMCGLWLPISFSDATDASKDADAADTHFTQCRSLLTLKLRIHVTQQSNTADDPDSEEELDHDTKDPKGMSDQSFIPRDPLVK